MYKTLVIGCGNIGAMYDFDNDQVLTHTKAFAQNPNFEPTVFDIDTALAQKVAQHYGIAQLHAIDSPKSLQPFDVVCICTPTPTHTPYLMQCLEAAVQVIVCEKPISYDEMMLLQVMTKALFVKTKIMVNYMRNFQPSYRWLQEYMQNKVLKTEKTTQIIVKYYKGFMNYCSHALHLLTFLFGKDLHLLNYQRLDKTYDFFEKDPTLTAFGLWDFVPVQLIGLTKTNFAIFEIELYFENHKILLKESGNLVEIYEKTKDKYGNFDSLPTIILKDCLKNYMENIVIAVQELLENKSKKGNFSQIASLDLYLLELSKK
jgi:hypothetical protein